MASPVFPQQSRSHLIEQLLDPATVLQGPFQGWNHGLWDVEAAPATFFGEGQQMVGMLVPSGTGGAMGPDAGLIDLG
jgi:hypothetical protein